MSDETEQRYRDRAKEIRAIAKGMKDKATREKLMVVADEYEQMSRQVAKLDAEKYAKSDRPKRSS